MTRVLVTGALGLIGSAVCRDMQSAGYDVTAVDDGRAAVTDHCHGVLLSLPVEALHPDRIGRRDVVVHCAAPVGPVGILGQSVLADMLSSTTAAIELARAWDAAMVVMSSSEVYGTVEPGASLVVPDEWSHRTEYGVGKIATEQYARRHHHETSLPTMVVRPWNVVGPHQAASKGFVIPRMAEQAAAGRPVTVYAPGSQRRAFMHVDDLSAALTRLVAALDGPAWDGTPIDAATPENAVSMVDLAAMFSTEITIVDPRAEHGDAFREAAAGSKLPPPAPAIHGRTRLEQIVAEARDAAYLRLGVAA